MSVSKTPQGQPNAGPGRKNFGELSMIGFLTGAMGAVLLLVSLLGILNTIFGWRLTLNDAALPDAWDSALGLLGVAIIWCLIWLIVTKVPPVRDFGRRRPWLMTGIIVGAITGAIVAITIVDNANIETRRLESEAKAKQDALNGVDASYEEEE